MIRVDDWVSRLAAVFAASAERRFEWGKFDCALFAADCVLAMTGEDLASEFRGQYSDADGARDALRSIGSGDLESTAAARLGRAKAPAFAQRGDVVLLELGNGATLGVVDLTGRFCLAPDENHGLRRLPLARALVAWGV